MSRRCVQYVSIVLVIVRCLTPGVFAQEPRDITPPGNPADRLVDKSSTTGQAQDSLQPTRESHNGNLARLIGDRSSWSILSSAPMAAVLRELAIGRPSSANAKTNIAYEVLILTAKSAGAVTTAITERSNRLMAGMITYRSQGNRYTFDRPGNWREGFVGADALREEEALSGEIFVSPESEAFISSAYRSFESGFDGAIPIDAITPEILIEKLLRKLRRLPGLDEARETARSVSIQKGFQRAEVGIEISFRPTINDASVPFVGRAVILRNSMGVFELIGLRQSLSPPVTAKIIELSLNSAKLTGQ